MSTGNVIRFPTFPYQQDLFIVESINMRTCISVHRYGKLLTVLATEPWIDAVNRLLRAKQRPDPKNKSAVKWWTQGDLADTAGVRANTLSDMMNNKREPSVDTLKRIAQALDVPMFFMMMTEAEQQTYLGARETVVRESAEEVARREAREYYMSKIDGLFDQWQGERATPPREPAAERPHVAKARKRA